jgi:HEAT repeat protein
VRLKKRLLVFLAIIAFVAFVGILIFSLNSRVPIYGGKTVRTWLLQFSATDPNGRQEAEAAFRALGTNAVPELVRLLRADDARWRKLIWSHSSRIPRRLRWPVMQRISPLNAYLIRPAAARALALLGVGATAAEPNLVWALQDKINGTYWEAGTALGRIGRQSVPDLTVALRDPDTLVRCAAAHGLGEAGADAAPAVPALLEMQSRGTPNEQQFAAQSLAKISPHSQGQSPHKSL